MAKKQFEQYLSRRIMGDNGKWQYFCRICGEYQDEDKFYASKYSSWGLDTRCKLHYKKHKEEIDHDMDYLKLDPLTEEDFYNTQIILQKMGYKFGPGEKSVHEQFLDRHPHLKNFKNDDK